MPAPSEIPNTAVGELIVDAIASNATDVHLHAGGPIFYRVHGKLTRLKASPLLSDDPTLSDQGFKVALNALGLAETRASKMVGFRSFPEVGEKAHAMQCRCQRATLNKRESLFLRLQPESPPPLALLLKGSGALSRLTNSQGLVLVVGPVGAGKTTFAAALARHWADQGRHVLTCEDPVEYTLNSPSGFVSHQDVSLAGFSKGISLNEAELEAMRLDIDALYVGETRNAETLQFALKFARSFEPVVTTYHAGSIGDAITSLYQVSKLPWEVAKSAIGSVLSSVVYVNLAFTAAGAPTPVIMVLPINDPAVRNSMLKGDQHNLGRLIEDAANGARPFEGQISRKEAITRAIQAGATKESAEAAMPPEYKGDSRQIG